MIYKILLLLLLPSLAQAQILVNAGGDLQAALNAAQPGETITVAAGATFTGNFVLPAKVGNEPITVRTNGDLPTGRVSLDDAPEMPLIRSSNSIAALRTATGSGHWRLLGLMFVAGSVGPVVQLGDGLQTSAPADFVLDQVIVQATPQSKNGVEANVAQFTFRRSVIVGVKLSGQESHALISWNGPGPFLIEDNYIEAGSCGVFFGGAAPSIADLIPSDITVINNTLTRPVSMRSDSTAVVKNVLELKNAKRVVIRGNIIENNWIQGQSGYIVVFTVRANSPTAPWSTIQDVLFENNVVRHSNSAFNILGIDNQIGSNGQVYPSVRMNNVVIRNNMIYDIDRWVWGTTGGGGIIASIDGSPTNLTFEDNTMLGNGNILGLTGDPIPNFTFRRNIVQKRTSVNPSTGATVDSFGVFGNSVGEGNPAFARYLPGTTFTENVLAGCTPAVYSAVTGNLFPSVATLTASFTNVATEDYRSTFAPVGADLTVVSPGAPISLSVM